MKKIDLGQSLTILANVGVIVGIVFLAFELQQTRLAIAGSAYQARALAIMERQDMLAESDHLAPILRKVESVGLSELDDSEMGRLNSTALGAFYRVDGMFYQYELGLLPDDYYAVFASEMRLWGPRWRDQGILSVQQTRGSIRKSFQSEISKFMDCEFDSE